MKSSSPLWPLLWSLPRSLARVLSLLMALQARLPLLNFAAMAGEQRETYFAAVQAGLDRNYQPMEQLFAGIIEQSLAASAP